MNRQQLDFSWLGDWARNVYSQSGEDGVLAAIFAKIGAKNQWCMECGAADGLFFSNTRHLIDQGWSAVLIEADPARFDRLAENCLPYRDRVKCVPVRVGGEHSLESILQRSPAPFDFDLAVVDVDGQDWYVWNSLLRYQPRVVVCEFSPNADPDFIPMLGGNGQAGWKAIHDLGIGKFYWPIFQTTTNVIFVKQPLEFVMSQPPQRGLP